MMQHRPITVLIVDDEPLARSGIGDLVGSVKAMEVVGECSDGRAAVAAVHDLRPDLVLLDVQMPGMNGFEVLQAVGPDKMPFVVFITAYDRFALDAFEVNAVDYLLKPFSDERFTIAMERAAQAIDNASIGDLSRRLVGLLRSTGAVRPQEEDGYLTRFVIRNSGRVFFVRVDEVDWIEAADYYVKLHVQQKVHLLRQTMQSLESRLDPERFFVFTDRP